MKSTFSQSPRMLCQVLTLAAIFVTAPLAKAQANANQVNDLTGSWLVSLTATQPGPAQFLALATYTKDGTFVGSAQGDGLCCPIETPAHGVWKKTGPNTFSVSFYTILFNADATGSLYGTFRITMSWVLDEKAGTATGTWQGGRFDPGGNLILPFSGTLTASRIPLP